MLEGPAWAACDASLLSNHKRKFIRSQSSVNLLRQTLDHGELFVIEHYVGETPVLQRTLTIFGIPLVKALLSYLSHPY